MHFLQNILSSSALIYNLFDLQLLLMITGAQIISHFGLVFKKIFQLKRMDRVNVHISILFVF